MVIFLQALDILQNLPAPDFLSIPIPEGWDSSAIVVYYVDAATGEMTDMKGTVSADGKYMVFETGHFSTYLLATTKEVKAPEGSNPPAQPGTTPTQPKPATLKGDVPQTGDTQSVVFWMLLFAGSILCIAGTGVLKTMKRR